MKKNKFLNLFRRKSKNLSGDGDNSLNSQRNTDSISDDMDRRLRDSDSAQRQSAFSPASDHPASTTGQPQGTSPTDSPIPNSQFPIPNSLEPATQSQYNSQPPQKLDSRIQSNPHPPSPIPHPESNSPTPNSHPPEREHAFDQAVISWESPSAISHEKGRTWYLMAATFVIGMVVYAILTNSVTMAIAFLLMAGVYKLVNAEETKIIPTAISELGIKYGNEIYPFHQIKAFWIIYNDQLSQLHLLMPKRFPRELCIELGLQDPNIIRQYLVRQIPEYEGREEKGVDLLSRLFKL